MPIPTAAGRVTRSTARAATANTGVGTSFAPALVVSLKENGTIPTPESFLTVVCAGRPELGMPAWCTMGLEIDKIQKMYLYLKSRADGKIAAGRPALRTEG